MSRTVLIWREGLYLADPADSKKERLSPVCHGRLCPRRQIRDRPGALPRGQFRRYRPPLSGRRYLRPTPDPFASPPHRKATT
jgi:hypothetical protein